MAEIDHLVYFVPDLGAGIDAAEQRYGARPTFGGQHPGRGTHNALLALGDSYLELIAPDPGQADPAHPRPFGIDERDTPGFVAFAVRPGDDESLAELVEVMQQAGVDPGPTAAMSRATPDGSELRWRLTFPSDVHGPTIPFLIDWGTTPKPHTTAPPGPPLRSLALVTSDVELVERVVRALRLDDRISVSDGPSELVPSLGGIER